FCFLLYSLLVLHLYLFSLPTRRSSDLKIRDNIKLLSFTSKIGVLDPVKAFITGKAFTEENEGGYKTNEVDQVEKKIKRDLKYLKDRKSTRLNSSHVKISYAVFCLKKKK